MIKLEDSTILMRRIRQDDPSDLAIPTWSLVHKAIEAGKVDEAINFVEYGLAESKSMHDSLVSLVDDVLTYLAHFGEEELEKFLRQLYNPKIRDWLSTIPGLKENLQVFTEFQRSHFSDFTVTEEHDRYVIIYDPCGSGGRLMRNKHVARTKKAYSWSWGKKDVPYYCLHCCMAWEVIPVELRGYPLRINLIPEKKQDPCVHLYYKKPEYIPEEYFTRIGMTKTIM